MKSLILQNRNTYIAYSTALYSTCSLPLASNQFSWVSPVKRKKISWSSFLPSPTFLEPNLTSSPAKRRPQYKKILFFQSRKNEQNPHTHCPYELSNATAGTPFSVGPTRRCYLRRGGSRDLIEMSGGKRPSSGSSSAKITTIVSNWIVLVSSFRGLIIPCLLISFFVSGVNRTMSYWR